MAAITGMLARMERSSIGNAPLSSPPFPAAGCLSPPEAKICPAAPCWESIQLEKGSAGGKRSCGWVTGMGTQPGHTKEG